MQTGQYFPIQLTKTNASVRVNKIADEPDLGREVEYDEKSLEWWQNDGRIPVADPARGGGGGGGGGGGQAPPQKKNCCLHFILMGWIVDFLLLRGRPISFGRPLEYENNYSCIRSAHSPTLVHNT